MAQDFRAGRVEVRRIERQLRIDDRPVAVGARAFDLLLALIDAGDRVVTKEDLFDRVWPGLVVEENNIQTQVSTLRKLLGAAAIATIPGRGYRLALRADTAAAPVPPDAARCAAPAVGACALPPAAPLFVGRNDDLRDLTLTMRESRMVTVLGAGGIGKTALALAAAHRARDTCRDGAAWVDLAPVAEVSLLYGAVGQALQLAVAGSNPLAALVRGLEAREMLLVLDNAEHLVDAVAALVSALTGGLPGLRLLVTSQAALRIEGERLFRLGALAVPAVAMRPDEAAQHGAVALFVAQARAADRRFHLTDDNVDSVVELCRRLDGVALAIKLAVARVPLLGLSGVLARIDERFRLLAGGSRDAPTRQQTLRAALDWSHGLLTAPEQAVFRRLGVFVGSFALDLASRAAADEQHDEWATIDLIGSLVDRSLVVAEPGETTRYRLLESAREYALLQLDLAGERVAAHARLADVMLEHFADLVAQQPQTLAWHLTEAGRRVDAVPYWARAGAAAAARSEYVEAAHHLERAVGLLRQAADADPALGAEHRRTELPLVVKLGSLHMLTRGIGSAEAEADFARALAIAEQVGTLSERFIATFNLWFVTEAQLKFERAGLYIDDTQRLALASGDPRLVVQAHHAGWTTSLVLGQFGKALEHTEAGYRLYRPVDASYHRETFVGHDPGVCSLGCQAVARFHLGDVDGARDSAGRALQAMRASDHVASRVVGAYCVCAMFIVAREPAPMRDVAAEALAACRRLSLTQYEGLFLVYTSWAAALADGDGAAADASLRGVVMFGSTGSRLRLSLMRTIAAETCAMLGRLDEAEASIELALSEIDAHGELGWKSMALDIHAAVLLARGRDALAEQQYMSAIETARSQHAPSLELRAANGLAALWAARGERARANDLLQPLLRRFEAVVRETPDLTAARAFIAAPAAG